MKKKKKNIVLVVDNEERQKLYNAPLSNYQNVSIKGNIGNTSYNDKKLFDYFLNDLCPRFSPRGMRTFKRKKLYLNVYLALSQNACEDDLIKANTGDISEGGCFIITAQTISKDKSRDIYVIIKELTDPCPIACSVKWVLPWGQATRHLPGVGVEFKNLNASQREEIRVFIRKTLTKPQFR